MTIRMELGVVSHQRSLKILLAQHGGSQDSGQEVCTYRDQLLLSLSWAHSGYFRASWLLPAFVKKQFQP